ncbi:MAG: hypothetical protein WCA84_03935 [Ignavibacteriaceae bacterium]
MVAEITAILTSLKTANDIIKGMNALKTESAISDTRIELGNIILDLQSRTSSLQQQYDEIIRSKNDLEKKLIEMSHFNSEKQKYILKDIAIGSIAYIPEEEKDRVGNTHWLCQNCLDNQKSFSVYQFKIRDIKGNIYYCPKCKGEIVIPHSHKFSLHS